MKYRKKPVVIDAVLWDGGNLFEVVTFIDGVSPKIGSTYAGMKWEEYERVTAMDGLKIYTLEGVMSADIGDYIIKGIKGEFYP